MSSPKLKYNDHLEKILKDPRTATKTYWSVFKMFVKTTKVHQLPLLLSDNHLATDFLDKEFFLMTF